MLLSLFPSASVLLAVKSWCSLASWAFFQAFFCALLFGCLGGFVVTTSTRKHVFPFFYRFNALLFLIYSILFRGLIFDSGSSKNGNAVFLYSSGTLLFLEFSLRHMKCSCSPTAWKSVHKHRISVKIYTARTKMIPTDPQMTRKWPKTVRKKGQKMTRKRCTFLQSVLELQLFLLHRTSGRTR